MSTRRGCRACLQYVCSLASSLVGKSYVKAVSFLSRAVVEAVHCSWSYTSSVMTSASCSRARRRSCWRRRSVITLEDGLAKVGTA